MTVSDRVILFADEAVPFQQMFPPCRVPKSMKKWPKGSRLLALDDTVPCPPERWCQRATCLQHPRSMNRAVPGDLQTAISLESGSDPAALAKRRTEECRDISVICKRSLQAEATSRQRLDKDVQSVTGTKHTVAMESLLRLHSHGHVDPEVAACFREGFPLLDWLPCSGLWEPDCEPPVLSEGSLQTMAMDITQSSVRNICKNRDHEVEQAVWASTKEEFQKGWLSFCDRASLPSATVVSTRFGVRQKNKIRPIDNFSTANYDPPPPGVVFNDMWYFYLLRLRRFAVRPNCSLDARLVICSWL